MFTSCGCPSAVITIHLRELQLRSKIYLAGKVLFKNEKWAVTTSFSLDFYSYCFPKVIKIKICLLIIVLFNSNLLILVHGNPLRATEIDIEKSEHSVCLKCRYKLTHDEFIHQIDWYHNGHRIYKYIGTLNLGDPKEIFYPYDKVKVNVS